MITISPLLPLNFTRVLTRVLGAGMPCCVRQGAAQGALTTDADHRRVARACLAARASRGRACAGPHGARHGARGRRSSSNMSPPINMAAWSPTGCTRRSSLPRRRSPPPRILLSEAKKRQSLLSKPQDAIRARLLGHVTM
eukprot:scaffold46716_cov72-Phaeocystis_antarctica.AAC.3